MINITVLQDSKGFPVGIELIGHAGYAEHGQDIVCASVSALVFNMANSVEQLTEDGFVGSQDEKTGSFRFNFTADVSLESKLLMNSLILGLESIEKEYGRNYIMIRYKEV